MKKAAAVVLVFCGMWLAAAVCCAQEAKPESGYQPVLDKDGWEVLFDGKDLNAWSVDPAAGIWAVNEQGELYPAKFHCGFSALNLF